MSISLNFKNTHSLEKNLRKYERVGKKSCNHTDQRSSFFLFFFLSALSYAYIHEFLCLTYIKNIYKITWYTDFLKCIPGYTRINFYSLFIHLMCLLKNINSYYYYLSCILSGLGDKAVIKTEKAIALVKLTFRWCEIDTQRNNK